LESAAKFDQYMITLASGAIGLSILFLEKVAKDPSPDTFAWLIQSWFLFAGALIAMLTSFLLNQYAWKLQRDILDLARCQQTRQDPPVHLRALQKKKNWEKNRRCTVVNSLNLLALILFFLGVVSFLIFVRYNFLSRDGEKTMTTRETKEDKRKHEERSAPPPTPPIRTPTPKEQPKPQTSPKK